MPGDDLVLNVRQVAGYPRIGSASASDAMLIQRGGLGGPYAFIDPASLVSTALSRGGDMWIAGQLAVGGVQTGRLQASNAAIALLGAQTAEVTRFNAEWGTVAGVPIATADDIAMVDAALRASTVWSFNGRRGDILLSLSDLLGAGGAPLFSPRFQGAPRAPTPEWCDQSTRIATTAWVQRNTVLALNNLLNDHPFVFSFNGRTGDVTLTEDDLQGAAAGILDNAPLTGVPTAPTAEPGTDTTQLATTAFVTDAVATATADLAGVFAPLNSPTFTGYPSGPTAAAGSSTGQLATTAFVMNAVTDATAGVASFNTRTGAVTLENTDIQDAGGALIDSPVFTGTPQAPTAAPGTSSSQIATCAWVMDELGGVTSGVVSFNGRSGAIILTSADLTSAGGALLASPGFSGVPTAPTAATGTNTGQLATCAYVETAIASINTGVVSFNGRGGAVQLTSADISAAGGAVLASPAFTGAPSAPTAAAGVSNAQIATTAFVAAAVANAGGVATFNGRAGAVTLSSGDVNATSAGGPYLSYAAAASRQNRNRLLNGSFLIDQRNAYGALGPWAAGAANFICDRWRGTAVRAGFMTSQVINGSNNASPFPSANWLVLTSQGSYTIAATDNISANQNLEYGDIADWQWGTANAMPVTLSFWAMASATGTYSGSIRNAAGTRSYPFAFAITAANTPQFFSIPIPGDTTGAWIIGLQQPGFSVGFALGVGANYLAPAGAWATGNYFGATGSYQMAALTGSTLQLANVQLEVGTQATPFDWRSFGHTLGDCQRYFQAPSMGFLIVSYGPAAAGVFWAYTFPVTMRAAPTVGASNIIYNNTSGLTFPATDPYGWRCSVIVTTGGQAIVNFNAIFSADM
jgi:hypothetical protein